MKKKELRSQHVIGQTADLVYSFVFRGGPEDDDAVAKSNELIDSLQVKTKLRADAQEEAERRKFKERKNA